MPGKSIVLVHPPFCMPDKPYISTAVLHGYLKEKGMDVSVLDLNIAFYREYLSQDNITQGLDFVEKRLESIANPRSPLAKEEYDRLKGVKKRMTGETPPFHLLFKDGDLTNVEQFRLFELGLDVVSARHFPERLEFLVNTGYIRYQSPWSNFSSRDIKHSIKSPSLYKAGIEKIVTRYLEEAPPLLVGISISFPDQVLPAFYTASVIKTHSPHVHVTMGGTYVSSHMREVTNLSLFDHVDSLILDEGEIPLGELASRLAESSSFASVPGLIYREADTVKKNPPVPWDRDRPLTEPDYTGTNLEDYLVNSRSMALLTRLSQGCYWHRCSFCRTERSFVRHYIQANHERVADWIESSLGRHPARIFHFTDDAADPDVLYELSASLIDRDLNLSFVTNMRFDPRLTPDKLDLYKQAGLRAIYFGLESCNSRVLKKMKKGITLENVEHTLKNCRKAGIPVHLYMIVGFPTETEAEARASFHTVHQWKQEGLAREVIYNVFQISGGSDIARNPAEYGISEINCPPGHDLEPPVSSFFSSGMTRERAGNLCLEFISRLNSLPSYSRSDMRKVFLLKEGEPA